MEGCGHKIGPFDCCSIVTGDAKKLALAIPDESIDLIFTDPVYDQIEDYRWLAEMAVRVLKQSRACLVFCGIGYLPTTLDALRGGGLNYRWQIPLYRANQNNYIWAPTGRGKYSSLLWLDKHNESQPTHPVCDIRKVTYPDDLGGGFKWAKSPSFVLHYLDAFVETAGFVWDPFCGGGTVPAVCKMLGRHWLAFEIDPEVAEEARERVRNTQPPLPGLIIEQTAMEL